MRLFCAPMMIGLVAAIACGQPADGKPPTPDPVEQTMADGQYQQCLVLLEGRQRQLRDDSLRRLSAWEIDFMGSEVDHAVVGRGHLYFTYHTPNSNPDAPGRRPTEGLVEPSRRSDWRHVVVCVDARTGRLRWSRPYGGLSRMAVDPESDTLYLIGSDAVIGLRPDGAAPTAFPVTKEQRVVGLLTRRGITVSAPHGLRTDWNRESVHLFCPGTGRLVEVDLRKQATLSPDESRRLVLRTGNHHGFEHNIICQTLGGEHLWSFQVPGLRSPCMPQFYGDDVIWLSGATGQKGQVFRLHGQTGKVVWRTVLPNGAYKSSDHQLQGGGYAWDDWDALMPLPDGHQLLAVGGRGRLFFLNAATGLVLGSARPEATHLCAPTQVGELVVLCSYRRVRAVSMAMLRTENLPGLDERQVLTRKARCLLALGRTEEALAAVDYVIDRDEDCAEAWRIRAEVCAGHDDPLEATYSLCRYAQLAEQAELPALRNRCGLLRMIPLGSRPSWRMVEVGGAEVYLGTQRGDLWAVRPETLSASVVEEREKEIHGLSGEVRLSFHALTGRAQTEEASRPALTEPRQAPRDWYTMCGDDGEALFYRGKWFRPLGGGNVRIWDGKELTERKTTLDGIEEWRIHMSPSGPLGYGTGIYALDGDLCPVRRILEPKVAGRAVEWRRIDCLRSVGDSLGMIVQTKEGAYLQVYGRDDGRLRNEAHLGRWLSSHCGPRQFQVLGDGYLLSDRQLVWAGGREGGGVWRFGPPFRCTETGRRADRWRYFGDPVLRDGKLLVAGLDGWLYFFDTGHILAAAAE